MTANLPVSEVSLIAGLLGLFFLIVAFYKSIFHRRRTPTAALTPEETRPMDDQPVHINDPFKPLPAASPQPDHQPFAVAATPAPAPESEKVQYVTAFRPFTPPQGGRHPGRQG